MQAQRVSKNANEQDSFRSIEDLQNGGINVSDIKKLQDHGLNTIGQVLQSSLRDLMSIKGGSIHFQIIVILFFSQTLRVLNLLGLSEAKVEKIREAARKLDSRGSHFKTGIQVKGSFFTLSERSSTGSDFFFSS